MNENSKNQVHKWIQVAVVIAGTGGMALWAVSKIDTTVKVEAVKQAATELRSLKNEVDIEKHEKEMGEEIDAIEEDIETMHIQQVRMESKVNRIEDNVGKIKDDVKEIKDAVKSR
jgi:predicted nuclease with TOPRIM domain